MTIDVYSATGQKKGTLELPASLFGAPIRHGLIHQAVVQQQSNRRRPIAHAKGRSEVEGSTRKLYAQKGTGRARRGSIRSPLLRGGGKAFGPTKDANFRKDMPKKMRHAALCSCLSFQAKKGTILGLESYPETIKTKDFLQLLGKLPIEAGRRLLVVLPKKQDSIVLSARNLPWVTTVTASYLNPEDVIGSRAIVFLAGAVEKVEEIFAGKTTNAKQSKVSAKKADMAPEKPKKAKRSPTAKKLEKPSAAKKPSKAKKSSASSK